jgi:transcriptional regulator with XRE-family HTH domain
VTTNLQSAIEDQRALYGRLKGTLLQQLVQIHGLTIRDFASIFKISKGHAEGILKDRTFPALPLALAISRYFEVSVEELFGWRVDDTGNRRPLVVDLGTGKAVRVKMENCRTGGALSLVQLVLEEGRGKDV